MSTLGQVTRFVITGGLTAVVYLSLSFLFGSALGMHYLDSTTLAYVLAVVFNFTVQKVWSFREKTTDRVPFQMTQFALWGVISLVGNVILVYLLVEIVHLWYLSAQAIATAIIAGASYFVYRTIFRS